MIDPTQRNTVDEIRNDVWPSACLHTEKGTENDRPPLATRHFDHSDRESRTAQGSVRRMAALTACHGRQIVIL